MVKEPIELGSSETREIMKKLTKLETDKWRENGKDNFSTTDNGIEFIIIEGCQDTSGIYDTSSISYYYFCVLDGKNEFKSAGDYYGDSWAQKILFEISHQLSLIVKKIRESIVKIENEKWAVEEGGREKTENNAREELLKKLKL
ncbi:MAG: hypothetical protein PHE59_04960 [Patescibacteria group bacterium]|nr:hypothetical protein [Patescibacteria group bacterium]MDD5164080.1 hypothetical protein [Patescibacteria group bacterium]MDD5534262.1 hypothetical protein [Patescibacteria group bacterium]